MGTLVKAAVFGFLIATIGCYRGLEVSTGVSAADNSKVRTVLSSFVVIVIAGFLIALATAFAGPIAFVGLAIPHLARAFFQTSNHRVILPAVIILGGSLTLLCNLIAKLPGFDTSLPINAVTSIIGAPVVIWVIVRRGRLKRV